MRGQTKMNSILVKLMCLLPLAVCSEPKSWDFMQSVGGLAIGPAYVRETQWFLPVRADVSGLNEITLKPKRVNSALICESTTAIVEGESIYLTVNTGIIREHYSPACPAASLGSLKEGNYRLFYRSPDGTSHELGAVGLHKNAD